MSGQGVIYMGLAGLCLAFGVFMWPRVRPGRNNGKVEPPEPWPGPPEHRRPELEDDEKYYDSLTDEDWAIDEAAWQPAVGRWEQHRQCHCGHESDKDHVCPKCGHKDRWEEFVGRMEWEHAPAVQWVQVRGRMGDPDGVWTKMNNGSAIRNRTLVRWTEEHCEVKP